MVKMFEPEQAPVSYREIGVEEIVDELFGGKNLGTVRDYFRKNVLHVYALGGATSKKKLTEENSARVRMAVCDHMRRNGKTIAEAGEAITNACGDEDNVIKVMVQDGKPLDEIYEEIKKLILKLS